MKSPEAPVLVVGTTPDYVHWIDQAWPGRAFFLSDPDARLGAREPTPDPRTEFLADLGSFQQCRQAVRDHLRRYNMRVSGIMCFDCEAMPLAAYLAEWLTLPYPSSESVHLCRDKLRGKQAWRGADVPCPDACIVSSPADAAAFFRKADGACVLKPLTGSGSEFVFLCDALPEVTRAFEEIREGLHRRCNNRLYADSGLQVLAEVSVAGPEYSCDFLLDQQSARIIRLARKIPLRRGPFGTAMGYIVPADLPDGVTLDRLEAILERAARSLGLSRAICMVDFIVGPYGPVLLELAPRPGGDCLPQLIRQVAGLDMLGLALDVAQGWPIGLPDRHAWKQNVGLRIHARQQGVLAGVDVGRVQADPRVAEIHISRQAGHVVVLPPFDYDSWILGYLIFRPDPHRDIELQCGELLDDIRIATEDAA